MTDFNQKTHDTDVGSHGGQSRQMMEVFENQEFGSIRLLQEAGNANYSEEDNPIALKADFILSLCELIVGGKHLINYAKTKDVFAAYKASGYNREFYEAHRDTLALRSAAKKAFDAYKKENGSDKKLPRISELNAEYAMLLKRKKSSYAEYRKTKSEMQDWLVAQKIVQEILKEDEQKKGQLHEQEVR